MNPCTTGCRVRVTNVMTATMIEPVPVSTPVTGEIATEIKISVPKGIIARVICSDQNLIQYSPLPDEPQSYDKEEPRRTNQDGRTYSKPRKYIRPMLVRVPQYNWKWLELVPFQVSKQYHALVYAIDKIGHEIHVRNQEAIKALLETGVRNERAFEATHHLAALHRLKSQLELEAFGSCP